MNRIEEIKARAAEATCEHDWVHLDTIRRKDESGYTPEWKRIDLFYCRKCLEQRETTKRIYDREKPDWY